MTDPKVVELLELLYIRGFVMFGEDEGIERLLEELKEERMDVR